MVSGEDLCLRRPEQGTHRLLGRVDLQRLTGVDHGLVPEHPEVIVGTDVNATDAERAPPGRAKTYRQYPFFSLDETHRARIGPHFHLESGRQFEEDVETFNPITQPEPDPNVEQFAFERPFAVELDLDVDARCAHLQGADCRDHRKRCSQEDQLRQT
jgi:hypothetical protein